MAGMMGQHWLQPDWDPGLTIAHLALSHLTAQGIEAAVLDVDRTLLPGVM
jgi:predicted HAD superfamily phosphohydrolase YqeG